MDRNEFHLFLKKYAENRCTPEEVELVDHWYELIGDDTELSSMKEDEWQATEERLWVKIQADTRQPVRRMKPLYRWAIAAALAGVIIGAGLFFASRESDQGYVNAGNGHYKEAINSTTADYTIKLEDGTVITLYPGASMKYPLHFNTAKREVYLKGKAFFDVGKDANRPFYVYSKKLVTHVLGTSFTIAPAVNSNEVEVSVRSGQVEVYEDKSLKHNANTGVILMPNQRVIYRQSESSFETTLVESPQPVIQHNDTLPLPSLIFNDESLRIVMESLENYYGVEIVVEDEHLYNCPFTGGLTQADLYAKLDVICQSVGATYEIKGTRILLRGKGCI
ncbi:FecR family protein [Chitinophaga sp. CF118]|uniref:FecR family protein n=1 Tax=Chitinophaga sp. CF118 TaxID=1884367 RepID=UPI0008EDF950|nr:FecR family protein [Chitinophaga sp. CF118]SFD77945.1 FecR family protein [Chitinophaga sp. CF118]